MEINCIVLAGGKSLRLGTDKISQSIGSGSLLQQVVSRLSLLCTEVIIVASAERDIPAVSGGYRTRIVRDIIPGRGPLVGVYSGLAASDCFYNLVVAGDMPFLNRGLLTHMIQVAEGFDLVIPRVGDLVEPLHAVYSKNCLAPIKYLMNESRLAVHQLLKLVNVRYVESAEIERFDPDHLSFFNINTAADLAKARKLVKDLPE